MQLTMDEKMEDVEMMISIFKSALETEKVTFDEPTNTFTIHKRSTMIGIYDEFTNNAWKFLNKDKNNVLANKLLSEKVIKTLGL
jgi:alcohol dehydrogenase YqhD (iron-dependent ADH family)